MIKKRGQISQLYSIHAIEGEEVDQTEEYLPENKEASHATHQEVTTLDSLHVLMENFKDLFQEPNSLPPQRPLDYAMPLKPHTAPVNIRAYRYSSTQRAEIEKHISSMLATSFIQSS